MNALLLVLVAIVADGVNFGRKRMAGASKAISAYRIGSMRTFHAEQKGNEQDTSSAFAPMATERPSRPMGI